MNNRYARGVSRRGAIRSGDLESQSSGIDLVLPPSVILISYSSSRIQETDSR